MTEIIAIPKIEAPLTEDQDFEIHVDAILKLGITCRSSLMRMINDIELTECIPAATETESLFDKMLNEIHAYFKHKPHRFRYETMPDHEQHAAALGLAFANYLKFNADKECKAELDEYGYHSDD